MNPFGHRSEALARGGPFEQTIAMLRLAQRGDWRGFIAMAGSSPSWAGGRQLRQWLRPAITGLWKHANDVAGKPGPAVSWGLPPAPDETPEAGMAEFNSWLLKNWGGPAPYVDWKVPGNPGGYAVWRVYADGRMKKLGGREAPPRMETKLGLEAGEVTL